MASFVTMGGDGLPINDITALYITYPSTSSKMTEDKRPKRLSNFSWP